MLGCIGRVGSQAFGKGAESICKFAEKNCFISFSERRSSASDKQIVSVVGLGIISGGYAANSISREYTLGKRAYVVLSGAAFGGVNGMGAAAGMPFFIFGLSAIIGSAVAFNSLSSNSEICLKTKKSELTK